VANPHSPRLQRAAGLAALVCVACTLPALLHLVGPEPSKGASEGPGLSSPAVPSPAASSSTVPSSATASRSQELAAPPGLSRTPGLTPSATGSNSATVQSAVLPGPALASFRGRVLGPTGEPVPGVMLSFVSPLDSALTECLTSPSGTFGLKTVPSPELRWQLTLSPPPATGLLAREQAFERTRPLGVHDLGDLRLEQGWNLSGVVVGPAGDPRAGVSVRLQDRSSQIDRSLRSSSACFRLSAPEDSTQATFEFLEPDLLLARTVTAKDGTFRLHAVEGRAQVLVAERGTWRARLNIRPRADAEGLRLVLDEGFALEALVRDERGDPIAGARVEAKGAEGDSSLAVSDAEGRALLPPVSGNRCEIFASAPGRRSVHASSERGQALGRTQITLTFGAVSTLRGDCAEAGLIWARARAGSPYVLADRGDMGLIEAGMARIDPVGPFVFSQLAPGVYDLLLKRPDDRWALLAERVRVEARGERDLGDLTPKSLAPLRLRVLSAEGDPVRGALLRGLRGMPEAKTDGEGRCELALLPGEHDYALWEPDTPWGEGPILVKTPLTLRGGLGMPRERTVRLRVAGAHLRVHTPKLTPTPEDAHSISVFLDEGQLEQVCEVSRSGLVEIPLARGGRYRVTVDGFAMGHVEVPQGGVSEVQFKVHLTPIEVQVLDDAGQPLEGLEVNVERALAPLERPALLAPAERWTDSQGRARSRLYLGKGRRAIKATVIRNGRKRTYRIPVLGRRIEATVRWEALASRGLTLSVPAGEPGETLHLIPLEGPANEAQTLVLDAQNRAVFPSLAVGTYRARLEERSFSEHILIPSGTGPIRLTLQGRGAASVP